MQPLLDGLMVKYVKAQFRSRHFISRKYFSDAFTLIHIFRKLQFLPHTIPA